MKLETFAIDKIIPYPNNPRHNENAVDAVAESIRKCTYIQPIIVDENNVVLAGHTRLKALKKLGYEQVPVLVYEGLTEEQKKKFRYLDNKTGEAAEWDIELLMDELADLDLGDLDFFNMENEEFEVPIYDDEATGAIEYEAEGFEDEQFKYECPECGFHFN